jgi:peptidoglycan/LPS O-acetylase OafA/YrhL
MTLKYPHLTNLDYRPDIDGLRAVAVLAVVTFHAFPKLLRGGFIGVDIFFVISGYLISSIIFENLDKGKFSFIEFYSRRIKRIFPALLLVLIACFAFGWFALLANEYKQLGKHIASGASFISNFILWDEAGYFDNSAATKPLLHLWSLSIEEQFYIAWPLLLWLVYKYKFNFLTFTILVTIASFILNILGINQDKVATFYSPLTRFWELLTGSLVAWLTLYRKQVFVNISSKIDALFFLLFSIKKQEPDGKTLANVLSFFGFMILLFGFYNINKELSFPGIWALVPVLGTVLIITAGSKAWVNRTILANKIAVWFGLISYALYLWHWPILAFAHIIESEVPSLNMRIAAIALSIALAWLTYYFIERPLRFGYQGKVTIPLLILLMVIVGYIGFNTYDRNGLSFRFPKMVQELANFHYDNRKDHLGSCLLDYGQISTNFNHCDIKENKNNIIIWGDSHADHLVPGLVRRYDLNLIRYTFSACPPIFDFDVPSTPLCLKRNNFLLNFIKRNSFESIILSANWIAYDLSKIEITINTLKHYGIKNIYLVGPVPYWPGGIPRLLVNHFNKNFPHVIPTHLENGLNTNLINLDAELRTRIQKIGVVYISPKDILCDDRGCLARTSESSDSIIAWDSAHLTRHGSIFLVSKFPQFIATD